MQYAYPFQKIVDLKSNEKKQAESGLSQAIGALARIEGELVELTQTKQQMQKRFSNGAAAAMPIAEIRMGQEYLDYLEACIQTLKRKLLSAEQAVEERRQALTDKSVDEKVWLKAKEKAYDAYLSAVSRRTQNELDEMASNIRRRH